MANPISTAAAAALDAKAAEFARERLEAALSTLQYGELVVVFHQGRVFEVKTLKRERTD